MKWARCSREPEFLQEAPVGINCASGFIRFAADGTPSLEPHHPEHRCRHVLKGRWDGSLQRRTSACRSFSPLLGQLLQGVFEGDLDAKEKVALLQEVAGAAAIGYGTKLMDPKAVILKERRRRTARAKFSISCGLATTRSGSLDPSRKMSEERYLPQLAGKYLNAADELSNSTAIAGDTFKSVITGEPRHWARGVSRGSHVQAGRAACVLHEHATQLFWWHGSWRSTSPSRRTV